MSYDPAQVAEKFHASIEKGVERYTQADHFRQVLSDLAPEEQTEDGKPIYFSLPDVEVVTPLIAELNISCIAIARICRDTFFSEEDLDVVTYLVFEDLSFLAWDYDGPADDPMQADNSSDDFRFNDLANETEELNPLAASKAFLAKEGSMAAWRERWGAAENRYPEDPSAEVNLYYEMEERLRDVRDPYVDHSEGGQEWSNERAVELEEEIFDIAAAVLDQGHRMEITINSAPEIGDDAEIDLEHMGPKGNTRHASLDIFARLLNLEDLYGYQLEYSDSGDSERMSSHYKYGIPVVTLEIASGDFSAHEIIEARQSVVDQLVKSGLSPDQAAALLKAAHDGEPIPEGIKPRAA